MYKYHPPSCSSEPSGDTLDIPELQAALQEIIKSQPDNPKNDPAGNVEPQAFDPKETDADVLQIQRPAPRLNWIDEDEDWTLPNALHPHSPPATEKSALGRSFWPHGVTLMIGPIALAGILLFLTDGLSILATAQDDIHTVPVETITIDPNSPSATFAQSSTTRPSAPAKSGGEVDTANFDRRFEAAEWKAAASEKLREKIQDRMKQDALPGLMPAPTPVPEQSEKAAYNSDSVLGYAPAGALSPQRREGHTAITKATTPKAEPTENRVNPVTAGGDADSQTSQSGHVTASVNLRGDDKKDAQILAVVPEDAEVKVGACDKWWCAVTYEGQTGFVGVKYVKTGS